MSNKGFSLIELIIAIVILSFGAVLFITLMNASTVHSIDPMVRQQANAVARAYQEEIALKSFCDPDLSTDCVTFCNTGPVCTNCSENTGLTETRATYDDICDYNGLPDTLVRDQTGNLIIDLNNYRVDVNIFDDAGGNLNGLTAAAGQSLRIDVTVTHTANSNVNVTVSNYRTNF